MFAVGAGGVHAWEIPIGKFHIFMMVNYYGSAEDANY